MVEYRVQCLVSGYLWLKVYNQPLAQGGSMSKYMTLVKKGVETTSWCWFWCWGKLQNVPAKPKWVMRVNWDCLVNVPVHEIFNSHVLRRDGPCSTPVLQTACSSCDQEICGSCEDSVSGHWSWWKLTPAESWSSCSFCGCSDKNSSMGVIWKVHATFFYFYFTNGVLVNCWVTWKWELGPVSTWFWIQEPKMSLFLCSALWVMCCTLSSKENSEKAATPLCARESSEALVEAKMLPSEAFWVCSTRRPKGSPELRGITCPLWLWNILRYPKVEDLGFPRDLG